MIKIDDNLYIYAPIDAVCWDEGQKRTFIYFRNKFVSTNKTVGEVIDIIKGYAEDGKSGE